MKELKRFLADEQGMTIAEYAMIIGIITFAALMAVIGLTYKFMVLLVS